MAQTPPWAFYPLGVGDVWEYDETETGTVLRVHNVGDTTIAGRIYVVQVRTRFTASGIPSEAFPRSSLRYDTVSARVMKASFTVPGDEFVWYLTPCPLDAAPPTAMCGEFGNEPFVVDAYVDHVILGADTLKFVPHKQFESSSGGVRFRLAAGVGEVHRLRKFQEPDQLRYARINGVEYGSPLYPVATAPPVGPLPGLRVEVWPNPVRSLARLAVATGTGGPARAEVHDILGRRVVGRDLGRLPPGRHEAELELAALAPGVYLLHVKIGLLAISRSFSIVE